MKTSTKCTVVTVILMVSCFGIGMVAGVYLGYRSGTSTVATISINTQVHDLENRVEALQAQRNQGTGSAIEIIEHGLDQDIVLIVA